MAPFLEALRQRDIRVWAEGDRLHCDGPPGSLTPELREQLRAVKESLLEFLHGAQHLADQLQALVPLTPRMSSGSASDRPPLFGVGGHNGDVFCFRGLVRHLGPEQPFYGLQPPGADGRGEPLTRVEDLAAYFVEQIRAFQPEGPYYLVGYCAGGTIAFEMAQQLRRLGASVGLLALIGSPHPHQFRRLPKLRRGLNEQWQRLAKHAAGVGTGSLADRRRYLAVIQAEHRERQREEALVAVDPALLARARLETITLQALARYELEPYEDRMVIFLPSCDWMQPGGLAARWMLAARSVEEHYGPEGSDGDTILRDQHAEAFAAIFRPCVDIYLHADLNNRSRPLAPPTAAVPSPLADAPIPSTPMTMGPMTSGPMAESA
ncbi:MAG TPA: thioesterase domain-containing protein [Rhodocyclaceae bacterium]|nr:thioesterase domain-containing protein [Rhodocyclaceae bacterium]